MDINFRNFYKKDLGGNDMLRKGQVIKKSSSYPTYGKKKWMNYRVPKKDERIDELLKDDECRQILMDYYIEYFDQYITHEGASLRLFKICRDTEKVLSEEWSEYRSILTNTFQTEMLLNELKPYIEESTNITYEMDQENDFSRIIRFYFYE